MEATLPALSGSGINYNAEKNIFFTNGYTSLAGNTYYQGIRLSNRIVVKLDLGEGYLYTFLNGVQVYGFNGCNTRLIGSRSYNGYIYSDSNAKQEAAEIVCDYLMAQSKMLGASINRPELQQFATTLVNETYIQTKRIALK